MSMLPLDKLRGIEERYQEILRELADPDVYADPDRLRRLGQEQAELEPAVSAYRAYVRVLAEIDDAEGMLSEAQDDDMREMIEAELKDLGDRSDALAAELEAFLVPKDPYADRDVVVEIRAGTGGEEASLWAADLASMYARYAEAHGLRTETITASDTPRGGFKEIIFEVTGHGAYQRLKWESGVHRVQRVPDTEAQGRIHTSTATVAVLPAMDEIDIDVPESDIRVDVFRSSGPGGQSVNTTDSAVRITHLPTGLVVSCQDQKSQLQNRRKALQVLRARLHQIEEERRMAEISEARRSQIGSGERAEKIRTYNFPQSRVTDHRVGLTLHKLEAVLMGDLDELVEALEAAERGRLLEVADVA